jgi:hypothetical protein
MPSLNALSPDETDDYLPLNIVHLTKALSTNKGDNVI